MKIQLVHPPVFLNRTALTALRPGPPLGLAYIAATLRHAGHECSVLDCVAAAPTQLTPEDRVVRLGLTNEEILERIDPEAEAIGITNMWSFSWPAIRSMIHAVNEYFPEKYIVCGGEHFTALPEISMQTAPIDYIVLGEGEGIALDLFEQLGQEGFDPARIAGLCFREGEEIICNPRAPRTTDINEIPWPAWDLFDLDSYDEHHFVGGIQLGKTVPILATRGCPYQCTYCSSPQMWTTKWYARDPVNVVDEIQHYHETYGADNFPFQDLTAIIKKDWVIAFCKELISRDLSINWQMPTGTRCDVIDEEVARLLYESNGRWLSYAPESGSERTRKLIKKRMKTTSLMRAVESSVSAGLNVTAFFVIGFPHDTPEDLRESVKLVRKLGRMGVIDIAVAFFFPIPATELYHQLIESGRIELSDDFLMTPIFVHDKSLSDDRNYCDHISSRRLTLYKYWIVANFYANAWITHPKRPFQLLVGLIRGREDSKMGTFLNEWRRNLSEKLSRRRQALSGAQSKD